MNDNESQLLREVRALRAEVTRLKHTVELGIAGLGVAAAVIFPDLARGAVVIAVMILFALLISPVRHLILSSFLHKKDKPGSKIQ